MSPTTLRTALTDYLAVRRALGYKLTRAGLLLEQFVDYCEQVGADRVTREVALAWVTAPMNASPSWLSFRLGVVRSFATWLQASEPATEIPHRGWLPPVRRPNPYLYSQDEIAALLEAARRARWPLSAVTYETLIGLLAVTGMRIGEAIRLDRADVSLTEQLLTIWESKNWNSRQLVLHPTTVGALRRYLILRDRLSPTPSDPALFVHPAGNRIRYQSVQAMFRHLLQRAGITRRSPACRPTIHSLRHTFAVNTLIGWHRAGLDLHAHLPLLATWLGHTDPKWSYWYLSASPELLDLAGKRLESYLGWHL